MRQPSAWSVLCPREDRMLWSRGKLPYIGNSAAVINLRHRPINNVDVIGLPNPTMTQLPHGECIDRVNSKRQPLFLKSCS
jgi:hypothetical protein